MRSHCPAHCEGPGGLLCSAYLGTSVPTRVDASSPCFVSWMRSPAPHSPGCFSFLPRPAPVPAPLPQAPEELCAGWAAGGSSSAQEGPSSGAPAFTGGVAAPSIQSLRALERVLPLLPLQGLPGLGKLRAAAAPPGSGAVPSRAGPLPQPLGSWGCKLCPHNYWGAQLQGHGGSGPSAGVPTLEAHTRGHRAGRPATPLSWCRDLWPCALTEAWPHPSESRSFPGEGN